MKTKIVLILAGISWAALVGTGIVFLYHYEATSGKRGAIVSEWPAGSAVVPGDKAYQLVMVAHPHCPCTRASFGELERLMARVSKNLDVHMLFSKPRQYPEKWIHSGLFSKASTTRGVRVVIDEDGMEAKLFGGTTSGQVFLFNRAGELLFSGGITASRGHSGDNLGRSTIIDIVQNGKDGLHQTPFFGCALQDEIAQQKDEPPWHL